eukprot:7085165-Alexandrium_andersonii.AAC.1
MADRQRSMRPTSRIRWKRCRADWEGMASTSSRKQANASGFNASGASGALAPTSKQTGLGDGAYAQARGRGPRTQCGTALRNLTCQSA